MSGGHDEDAATAAEESRLRRAQRSRCVSRLRKKGGPRHVAGPSRFGLAKLEVEAQAELHAARRVCSGQMQETRAVKVRAWSGRVQRNGVYPQALVVDLVELRVIE